MRRNHPPDEHAKFHSNLRHYHRAGSDHQRSWDDWVEGGGRKSKRASNWPKIIGLLVGALAVAGIVTGLLMELS
jgi:hypothetical protein